VRGLAVLPPIRADLFPDHAWRIDRAMDYGEAQPSSIGWYAECMQDKATITVGDREFTFRKGDVVRFNEWYTWTGKENEGMRLGPAEITAGIVRRELEMGLRYQVPTTGQWLNRVKNGPADNSIFTSRAGTASIADDFTHGTVINGMRHPGIDWLQCDEKERVIGWSKVRERLLHTKPRDPAKSSWREHPGLFVTTNCEQWLRTVPVLQRNPKNMEDALSTGEDHVADEVRYRVMHDTTPPVRSGRVEFGSSPRLRLVV
jgi:hypothetical protein